MNNLISHQAFFENVNRKMFVVLYTIIEQLKPSVSNIIFFTSQLKRKQQTEGFGTMAMIHRLMGCYMKLS